MRRQITGIGLTFGFLLAAGCASTEFSGFGQQRSSFLPNDSQVANLPEAEMPEILPETYFAAGQLFEYQGNWNKAITQYRYAIGANNRFVEAYHRLGILLGRTGDGTESARMLARAVSLRPDDAHLHNDLGFAFIVQKQWRQAETALRRALELKPSFARAQVNLGMALSQLGRFEESLVAFKSALPEEDAYYNLGLMFQGQERFQDAAFAFQHVLRKNPQFTAAQQQLDKLQPWLDSYDGESLTAFDWRVLKTPDAQFSKAQQSKQETRSPMARADNAEFLFQRPTKVAVAHEVFEPAEPAQQEETFENEAAFDEPVATEQASTWQPEENMQAPQEWQSGQFEETQEPMEKVTLGDALFNAFLGTGQTRAESEQPAAFVEPVQDEMDMNTETMAAEVLPQIHVQSPVYPRQIVFQAKMRAHQYKLDQAQQKIAEIESNMNRWHAEAEKAAQKQHLIQKRMWARQGASESTMANTIQPSSPPSWSDKAPESRSVPSATTNKK